LEREEETEIPLSKRLPGLDLVNQWAFNVKRFLMKAQKTRRYSHDPYSAWRGSDVELPQMRTRSLSGD
jgi:hypothetical protein